VLVEQARSLAALVDDRAELAGEADRLEGGLPVVLVDVELAAIEILDADGESALTFRALAARLATGSGAIYWHVASKNDLLAAATGDVIARVMTGVVGDEEPREAIRAIARGMFDAIDVHP